MALQQHEKEHIDGILKTNDFDHAFAHFSQFEKVGDEFFHQLRIEFLAARNRLLHYIGRKEELSDNIAPELHAD